MAVAKKTTADKCLEGRLTVLRPIGPADLTRLAEWDQDPEITALMGRKFGQGGESPLEWYQRVQSDRRCRILAIETRDGRQLIGEIELDRIDWRGGTAEVRICIGDRSFRGRGYGPDALSALLGLAFARWKLKAVYLRVYQSNRRAVRCYQRLGFAVEGVLAPSRRRGDTSEILLMSLTREQFLRRQQQQALAASS